MAVKSLDHHLERARNCRQLAERALEPWERQALLDMARSYERMARQLEERQKSSGNPNA
jgi:hypothetical protein